MLNIKKAQQSKGKSYNYIPEEGSQLGVIVQVLDLGMQPQRAFQGKPKPDARTIRVTYELVNEVHDFDGEDKPLIVSEDFPFFSSEKSRCYQRLHAIDPGFKKTGGDWSKAAGMPVQVQIVHRTVGEGDDAKTYANIAGISPLMKGIPVPEETFNEVLVYSTDTPDQEVFDKLPDFLKERITEGGGAPKTEGQQTKKPAKGVKPDVPDNDDTEEGSDDDW